MTTNEALKQAGIKTIRKDEKVFLSYKGEIIQRFTPHKTREDVKEKWGIVLADHK